MKQFVCLFLLLIALFVTIAESPATTTESSTTNGENSDISGISSESNVDVLGTSDNDTVVFAPLPDGYRGIVLGTAIDMVKDQLLVDGEFGYRGERDVSLLLSENRSLIETAGPYFIKRAWFQFHNDSLYIISAALNTAKIDYYTLYTSLVQKYGEPIRLDPRSAVWENDSVQMILERPLTIRYILLPVFTSLQQKISDDLDYREMTKNDFLKKF